MSEPNSWATAFVRNNWGEEITNITLNHRYDNDHYDSKSWEAISSDSQSDGLAVGFWTGFGRTGRDYWHITFEAGGLIWTCKENFYCYLTSEDKDGEVICRLYKNGNDGKMDIICPKSSGCTVSLTPSIPQPNSWAKAVIHNRLGSDITNVELNHRYDNDHYDEQCWDYLESGGESSTMDVGFWTGFGRTGYDYWLIAFESEGLLWTCKDNFYCFLTKDDVGGTVTLRLYKVGSNWKMEVIPPVSSGCVVSLTSEPIPSIHNRPTYIVGHACNSPTDIGMAISSGCNGVECDLHYDAQNGQVYVNHDRASGTLLINWLNNAKDIMKKYSSGFALIIFDCKFATHFDIETTSGILLSVRSQVRNILNHDEDYPVNILFSISNLDNIEAFSGIMHDVLPNEGIAIDESDYPKSVEDFYNQYNVTNGWYGDGIFVAGVKDVYPYIKKGCELRDANGYIKKVYVWTLAKESSIDKFINQAMVDGVLVNVTGASIVTGLKEALKVVSESSVARMANRKDEAFSVYQKYKPKLI
ncbi:TPA: hypothetical protein ACF3A8_005392 [Klebsiella pneumoniae]